MNLITNIHSTYCTAPVHRCSVTHCPWTVDASNNPWNDRWDRRRMQSLRPLPPSANRNDSTAITTNCHCHCHCYTADCHCNCSRTMIDHRRQCDGRPDAVIQLRLSYCRSSQSCRCRRRCNCNRPLPPPDVHGALQCCCTAQMDGIRSVRRVHPSQLTTHHTPHEHKIHTFFFVLFFVGYKIHFCSFSVSVFSQFKQFLPRHSKIKEWEPTKNSRRWHVTRRGIHRSFSTNLCVIHWRFFCYSNDGFCFYHPVRRNFCDLLTERSDRLEVNIHTDWQWAKSMLVMCVAAIVSRFLRCLRCRCHHSRLLSMIQCVFFISCVSR